MSVRITCIKKDNGNHNNPHEGITHLSWMDEQTGDAGRATRSEIIYFIENQRGTAYVKDSFGNIAYVKVVTTAYSKYLRTYSDGKPTDNLLYLPECK